MTGDIDSFGSLAMIDKKISPLWMIDKKDIAFVD